MILRKILENMESGIACCEFLRHEFTGKSLYVRRIAPSSVSGSSRCFIVKTHPRYLSRSKSRSSQNVRLSSLRCEFSTLASASAIPPLSDEESLTSSSSISDQALEQTEALAQSKGSEEEELTSSKDENNVTSENPVPGMVIIVFDLETTGFRAAGDRIIEFAARDLAGGDRSTFTALVNPGRSIPNLITTVTGITNQMVNQPHILSWKEVGPAVIQFVESRRRVDELVILVAHNGRRFDVPFLLKEFQTCCIDVPEWWLFLDSMPLAREAKKKIGYNWRSLKLSDIHEAYGLQTTERAHRAMADVNMLASVLEVVVSELELPASQFLEKAFTAKEVYASSKLFQEKDKGDLVADPSFSQDTVKAPWDYEKDMELESSLDDVEEQMVLEVDMEGLSDDIISVSTGKVFIDTSSVDLTSLSTELEKYVEAKRKRPNFIHLLKAGDFYEALFEDAETLSRACKIPLSSLESAEAEIPVTRFPACKFYMYTKLLLDKGLSVVKIGGKNKEVLTPGMLIDEGIINETCSNYLVTVDLSSDSSWGLAYCDLSTGELCATQSEGLPALIEELDRLEAREVVYSPEAMRTLPRRQSCRVAQESSEFSPVSEDTHLLPYIGTKVLHSIQQFRLADCAARALLRHVQQVQAFALEELPIRELLLYKAEDYLCMDENVRGYLQLVKATSSHTEEGSLLWAMDSTKTLMGARVLRQWLLNPLKYFEQISLRHDAVEVLLQNVSSREAVRSYLSNLVDVERLSGSIARSTFSWDDLLALADSILILPKISDVLKKMSDSIYFSAVSRHQAVLVKLAEDIQEMLVTDIHTGTKAEDDTKNCQESETDTTTTNVGVEESLGFETRHTLQERVSVSLLALQETSRALAALDVLCGFAEIAATRDFCKPEMLRDGRQITIVDGRHPLAEITGEFYPTSCSLGYQPKRGRSKKGEERPDLLVLTGVKGSGKTSYLQQVALIQVLAQCGSFVPAKEARLSIADGIYSFDWPDTNGVLKKVTSSSLVLLDDFRVRTGFHGSEAALLRAVMEYLANHVSARTLVAMEDYYQDIHTESPNMSAIHFSSSHAIVSGLPSPPDGLQSGVYPEWIRRRANKLLEKNACSGDEAGSEKSEGNNLWHKIMSFTTKVKATSPRVSRSEPSEKSSGNGEDLEQLWQQVSAVLQSSPATLALATQKGSLLSISRTSQPAIVTIGSAPLFVRKFQQHEHAAALEAAFESLLHRPVKLQIMADN